MRIKIIEPSSYLPDGRLVRYPRLWVTGLTAIHLASLTPHEYEVSVANEVLEDINLDEKLDLVALTAMGHQLFRAIDLAKEFRERGVPVVVGGHQASMTPELVMPHADSVVCGEAEPVWQKILSDVQAGRLQRRYDGGSAAYLADLPVPRYDLLDLKRHSRLFPVEATRGCPKSCTFCAVAQQYRTSFRKYPVDDVVRNIEAVLARGVRNVFFVDANLTGDPEYAKRLFHALLPLRIRWASQATVEIADDPELLNLAAASGCMCLSIGFESINQASLRTVGKGFNDIARYRHVIDEIRRRNIKVNALIMFGFDDDREDVFLRTADFFDHAGVSLLDCFILVPMPGTPMFDRFQREGRLLTEDFRQYSVTNVVFQPSQMKPEVLHEGLWIALRRFYRCSSIVRRMRQCFGGRAFEWLAVAGLNLMYRRMVYARDSRHPNIWHAPYT